MPLPPRTESEWEIVYHEAVSGLESADVYGPKEGQLYVAKGANVQQSLLAIRNFLQRMWMDWDFNDIPEVTAAIDRVMNETEP